MTILIDSINSLICLYVERSICICNPITKEFAMLPDSKGKSNNRYSFKSMSNSNRYRFVYVSSTNEYKVVGIYPSKTTGFVKVRIFTLGSGSGWRNLGKVNSEFSSYTWTSPGVFANGALYWVDAVFDKIAIFDLAEEKFCEKKLPPPPDLYWKYSIIGDKNVSFCLSVPGDELYDLWILKNMKDGESLVWSKEGRFADNDDHELLTLRKSERVIGYSPYYLSSCSIKTPIWKHLLEFKDDGVQVCLHKNTLVSLKELGKADKTVMQ
ncbi:putative F-box protein At1g19160 [Papaver somniferum]|uniref:putative F-box protein At1g19160 n=1 Tax=Papaver somniferum TaxID=3469 RepID=UPI000E6F6F3C|nr:putative F-box protein At1g19160 [Papaver somniferum]